MLLILSITSSQIPGKYKKKQDRAIEPIWKLLAYVSRVQICFRTDPQPKLKPQRAHRAKMHKNRQFCKYATQSIPGRSFNLLCLYYLPVPNLNPKESSLLKEISLLPAVGMFSKLSCDNCCLAQPQTRS